MDSSSNCCFTGHRPSKLSISESDAKALLLRAVESAVESGYTTFITGMAEGIDVWAGEIVLSLRVNKPFLKLICAVPYPSFGLYREEGEKNRYNRIIHSADFVHMVSMRYTSSCYKKRNIWMVDNSSRLIAAYSGAQGGTRSTINYANEKGLEVVNILDADL